MYHSISVLYQCLIISSHCNAIILLKALTVISKYFTAFKSNFFNIFRNALNNSSPNSSHILNIQHHHVYFALTTLLFLSIKVFKMVCIDYLKK